MLSIYYAWTQYQLLDGCGVKSNEIQFTNALQQIFNQKPSAVIIITFSMSNSDMSWGFFQKHFMCTNILYYYYCRRSAHVN